MKKKEIKRKSRPDYLSKNLTKDNAPVLSKPNLAIGKGVGNIAQVFLNVNLHNSINGLLKIAKRGGININEFPRSNYLVFINSMGDRFKIMAPARITKDGYVVDWVTAYYSCPQGRVTPELIYNIPRIFAGRTTLAIPVEGAAAVHERLRARRERTVEAVAPGDKIMLP